MMNLPPVAGSTIQACTQVVPAHLLAARQRVRARHQPTATPVTRTTTAMNDSTVAATAGESGAQSQQITNSQHQTQRTEAILRHLASSVEFLSDEYKATVEHRNKLPQTLQMQLEALKCGSPEVWRKHLWLQVLCAQDTSSTGPCSQAWRGHRGSPPRLTINHNLNIKSGGDSNSEVRQSTYVAPTGLGNEFFIFQDLIPTLVHALMLDESIHLVKGHMSQVLLLVSPICYVSHNPKVALKLSKAVIRRHGQLLCSPRCIDWLTGLFYHALCEWRPIETQVLDEWGVRIVETMSVFFECGFVGHLRVPQLLRLWDLVIAYDSLAVLPLFAVGVVALKSREVLAGTCTREVETAVGNMELIDVEDALLVLMRANEYS